MAFPLDPFGPRHPAASVALHWLESRGLLDANNDPRVGSGRNDSSGGGTLSTASNNKSSSLEKLVATFVPVAVFALICVFIFFILRRRCTRVYAPRTITSLSTPRPPTPALPSGWFNWVKPFFKTPDVYVLHHGSLDGYFFLRFLKVLRNMCLVGCLVTWPVLFPINATGGRGLDELDRLTIGNVADSKRLYAHAIVACIFFAFVLYLIVRECIFYVNLRQAYLSSPYFSNRLSSRTMLLTCIPKEYLDERRLRKLYGDSVQRISIPRTSKALVNLVKEREQTARRLEKAELQLIKKANLARRKKLRCKSSKKSPTPIPAAGPTASEQDLVASSTRSADSRHGPRSSPFLSELPAPHADSESGPQTPASELGAGDDTGLIIADKTAANKARSLKSAWDDDEDDEYTHPYGLEPTLPDVRGSVAAKWIPAQSRPYHRPLGNYGRRVDTIRWTRSRLRQLNLNIFRVRRQVRRGDGVTIPSAFIEFDTQEHAQAAHQILAHHRPLQMSSRMLGIRPDEIVWSSLRMPWWERIIRRFLVITLVVVAVIFWSIPSAIIGMISNISFLSRIPFLSWLEQLPPIILGFLQGFVPAMALSLWMAATPAMLRFCGKQAGIPSLTLIELFTQNCYFAFQVVQVFLITTLTSAASAAFIDILKNPLSAKDVLAENLPMSSNFYLSYILIQCLASSGNGLLQIFSLIRHYVLSKMTDLPRARLRSWRKLPLPRWGGLFPVFTNMGVIALSFACIAPLVLIFAAGGMWIVYIVWKYNLIYVMDSSLDSKGLFYPRALLHLTIGLYLAEICLLGLFAINLSFIPVGLMALFLVFTGLVHFSLSDAIAPLLESLPQTLPIEEEIQEEDRAAAERAREQASARTGDDAAIGTASSYYDPEQAFGEEDQRGQSDEEAEEEKDLEEDEDATANSRAIEGASDVRSALTDWIKTSTKAKLKETSSASSSGGFFGFLNFFKHDKYGDKPPSFLARWLHPEEYEDFVALRKSIPSDSLPKVEYPEDHKYQDYLPPELWLPKPSVWIPRDEARVSRQEVAHTRGVTPTSDHGAWLDEKGRVVVHLEQAPFEEPQYIF